MSLKTPSLELPASVEVVIEVSAGTHIKWGADGRIDFISPLACPFNYGSAPGHPAPDGDPADVVVMGPPLERGHRAEWPVVGLVRFVDDGVEDHKWICAPGGLPLSPEDQANLDTFFSTYARCKRLVHRIRGRGDQTRYDGLETRENR